MPPKDEISRELAEDLADQVSSVDSDAADLYEDIAAARSFSISPLDLSASASF
jgi:hypothetical protein